MSGRRLRPVAAAEQRPLRLLGIIRVSKERDEMISPENQEHKIRGCADANGYLLAPAPDGAQFLYGLDESGSQRRSSWWRKLDQAIELVESGQYDGIIVWKFSRVARNRLKWNVALDRIEAAGGILISATEDFDVTTAAGRLGRGISGEFNAFQADMIGESWTEAHERRVRLGLPHTGKPKWGYIYDKAAKMHLPATEENVQRVVQAQPELAGTQPSATVVPDMYRRYIAGESVYALVRWLNSHGWRTTSDGPWTDRALRRVLDSGFASGRFMFRGELHPGIHEPLIDEATWQAYLDARGARRRLPARTERSQYLLSGMVRCARCGGAMSVNYANPGTRLASRSRPKARAAGVRYSNGNPTWKFRCQHGKETGRCKGGAISMSIVEAFVVEHLKSLAAALDARTTDVEQSGQLLDARRRLLLREEERLDREREKAKAALVQLALRDAERPMPREVYEAARSDLEQRISGLTEAIEAAGRTHRRSAGDPAAQAAQLLGEWDELPVASRREILRSLIDCVLVDTGRPAYLRIVEWEEVRPEAL